MATINIDEFMALSNVHREALNKAMKAEPVADYNCLSMAQRFSCSEENTSQVPKEAKGWDTSPVPKSESEWIKCPECEGTGHQMVMVCFGNRPVEKMIECEKCNGEGEIEMEVMTVEQVKERVNRVGGEIISSYEDFKNFIVLMIKNRNVYKIPLIKAIVEKYYLPMEVNTDFSKGRGKANYDYIDGRMKSLIRDQVLEPWTQGEPLRLKELEGGIIDPSAYHPSEAYAPEVITQVCPYCLGAGCSKCNGLGSYKVSVPTHDILFVDEASAISQEAWESITLRKRRRWTKKKYEMSNEEIHMKRGKRQRKKYILDEGDLQ